MYPFLNIKIILVILTLSLATTNVKANVKDKNPKIQYLALGGGVSLSYANMGNISKRNLIALGLGVQEDNAKFGLGIGTVLEYRYNFISLQICFHNRFYAHDFERDNFTKKYEEHPVAFHSMTLRVSPRLYYGGIFIAPEIGFENSYAQMKVWEYNNYSATPYANNTYKEYKHKGKTTGLISYGIKLGFNAFTRKRTTLIELHIGWSNIHILDAVEQLESKKYGFSPLKKDGNSDILEIGMTFSIPIIKKLMYYENYNVTVR